MAQVVIEDSEGNPVSTRANGQESSTTIIDLGSASRKKIKRLRRGEGKLLQRVNNAVDELRAHGEIPDGAHTLVVIVREKAKMESFLPLDLLPVRR